MSRYDNFPTLFLIVACSVLAGCATLGEGECRSQQWHEIGRRDGLSGYPAARIGDHQAACAEYGIRPRDSEYFAGRDLGLRQYCVFDNAIREGLAGRAYQHVRPDAVSRRFGELNAVALAVHRAREEIASLNRESDSLERERRKDKTSAERKSKIRDQLRYIDRKLDRARDDLRDRERDLDRVSRGVTY